MKLALTVVAVIVVSPCALVDDARAADDPKPASEPPDRPLNPPKLPPLDLMRRPHAGEPLVDADGDVSTLPGRIPGAVWLPLELTYGYRVRTHVKIEGHDALVMLDTGAANSLLSGPLARAIGLDKPGVVHIPLKLHDAQNKMVEGYRVNVGTIEIGPVRVHSVQPDVVEDPHLEGGLQAIIGAEVLKEVDLLFAVDDGQLGIFAPGAGKLTARDNVVRLWGPQHLNVRTLFDDAGRMSIDFTLDTGAPTSLMDRATGDLFGFPFDPRFATDIGGFSGVEKKSKGAWTIDHLKLGRERVDIGKTWVHQAYMNVLGCNVLFRQRTLLSPEHAELRLAPRPIRPATRSKRPDGSACAGGPCVAVHIEKHAGGGHCLHVHVDKAWAGKHVLADVEALGANDEDLLGGDLLVMHADVGVDGFDVCEPLRSLDDVFGLDEKTKLSLLHFHSVPAAEDACPNGCLAFTGIDPESARR